MSQYQCYMKYTYGVAHLSDDLIKSELLKQLPIKQRTNDSIEHQWSTCQLDSKMIGKAKQWTEITDSFT